MQPFLTLITPTFRRPKGLAACHASVREQTSVGRIQHFDIVDHIGLGIGAMYAEIPKYASAVQGQYVHLLCDDDELASPDVVAQVERFAIEQQFPPVILVAVNKAGMELPIGEPWPPVCGRIDLGCLIVRADVWKAHAKDYGHAYEGDYLFADAVYRAGHTAAWCPVLFLIGAVSRGAAEAA